MRRRNTASYGRCGRPSGSRTSWNHRSAVRAPRPRWLPRQMRLRRGPLSGSFHTSQASTRGSSRKAETTPVTYSRRRGYRDGFASAFSPGDWIQPELWTPGAGCGWRPSAGSGCQQEPNRTSMARMRCRSAITRNASTRASKLYASASHSRSCRYTRTAFMPSSAAQPSSRSIAGASKLHPANQGRPACQALARSVDRAGWRRHGKATRHEGEHRPRVPMSRRTQVTDPGTLSHN